MVFIKVRCLINVNLALRLFLKKKGDSKQHCLILFVGSNLGVETFLKKMEHHKRMCYNRGLRQLCILCIEVSRKFYICKACLPFNCFLVIKGILEIFLSFIPWLLNFWFAYGSNSRKRYALRLISPKSFNTLFDSLRWAPFSLALHLSSS